MDGSLQVGITSPNKTNVVVYARSDNDCEDSNHESPVDTTLRNDNASEPSSLRYSTPVRKPVDGYEAAHYV